MNEAEQSAVSIAIENGVIQSFWQMVQNDARILSNEIRAGVLTILQEPNNSREIAGHFSISKKSIYPIISGLTDDSLLEYVEEMQAQRLTESGQGVLQRAQQLVTKFTMLSDGILNASVPDYRRIKDVYELYKLDCQLAILALLHTQTASHKGICALLSLNERQVKSATPFLERASRVQVKRSSQYWYYLSERENARLRAIEEVYNPS